MFSENEKRLLKIIAALLFGMYRKILGMPWEYQRAFVEVHLKHMLLLEKEKEFILKYVEKISESLKEAYEKKDEEKLSKWITEIVSEIE